MSGVVSAFFVMETPTYDPEDSRWVKTYEEITKPFPNEHACRKTNPDKYKRFRRQNNKFGSGIHAIWGVTKVGEKVELQSIRFSKSKFTVAQAKKWLKDHDHTCILFEPASGGKMKKQFLTSVKEPAKEGPVRFRLTELAVDRIGEVVKPKGAVLKEYKKNPIVLFAHGFDTRVPIGKIDIGSIEITDKYFDADVIFDEDGKDDFSILIADKVRNGFLKGGSIGFRPITISKEPVLDGQTGVTHEKWELLEFSVVPIGALPGAGVKHEWNEFAAQCKELGHEIDEDWLKEYLQEEKDAGSGFDDTGDFEFPMIYTIYEEIKEGRVLSGKNKALVKNAVEAMETAAKALRELLEKTEPPKEFDVAGLKTSLSEIQKRLNSITEAH